MSVLLLATACAAHPPPASPISNQPGNQCARSIRDVDFQNRTYQLDGEAVSVKEGQFNRPSDADGIDQGFVEVDRPVYGDVDGDGRDDAIVRIANNFGGSGTADEARVFGMRGCDVVELAIIPGGDRADGGLVAVTPEAGGARVERNVMSADDAACCASGTEVEHWRWQDGQLRADRSDAATR